MADKGLRVRSIPESYRQPLKVLASLDENQVEGIHAALRGAEPTLDPVRLGERIAPEVDLPTDTLTGILSLLLSLAFAREEYDLSLDRIVGDVLERASEDLGITEQTDQDRLRNRLARLLAMERPLAISARALNILRDHPNVLYAAKIVTDVRPVFSSAANLDPVAAVVVHTLKIESRTASGAREDFFALDAADLRKLRQVIDRAIGKEEALKSVIDQGGLVYLTAPHDGGEDE